MTTLTKWCSYCEKQGHNDSDCQSTSAMNNPHALWFLNDADRCDGEDPLSDVYLEAWIAAATAFSQACGKMQGHSEWCERMRAAVRVLAAHAPEVLAAELEHKRRLSSGGMTHNAEAKRTTRARDEGT